MSAVPDIEQPVVDFFLALQRSVNAADAGAIAAVFAPELLEATPAGSRTLSNDEAFRTAIEERLALLRRAGIRDVKALQIDPMPLSTEYALARIRWSLWFTPDGRTDFVEEFLVDYLVDLRAELSIAAYIVHDNQADILPRMQLPAEPTRST
jgi:hypothetical protein